MSLTRSRTGRYYYRNRARRPEPTYRPSPELLAAVAAHWERIDQRARQSPPTRDLALTDADASITGWREQADAALHYRYPREMVA